MDGLIMAAQLITALTILVVVHEFGHFITARAFGIRVEKFYIFFDAGGWKLFNFHWKGTEWGMGWLPLGGYVKISGMIDESMDKEQMKQPPKDYEFRSKPAWQRLIVMVAGVIMNVILGIIIFSMLAFTYGETYVPTKDLQHGIVALELGEEIGLQTGDNIVAVNGEEVERFSDILSSDVILADDAVLTVERNGEYLEVPIPDDFANRVTDAGIGSFVQPRTTFTVDSVIADSRAEAAGLARGDKIVAVSEEPIEYFDEFRNALQERKGQTVTLTVVRDGQEEQLTAEVDTNGTLGFAVANDLPSATAKFGFFESFVVGTKKAMQSLLDTVRGLGKVFSGDIPANKAVSGPIGIATQFGAEWIWPWFWGLTGLLSMVLAFMNILPIPALDGGHVMLLLAEMVRGKALNQRVLEITQIIGVVIILTLMVLIFSNDIIKLVQG